MYKTTVKIDPTTNFLMIAQQIKDNDINLLGIEAKKFALRGIKLISDLSPIENKVKDGDDILVISRYEKKGNKNDVNSPTSENNIDQNEQTMQTQEKIETTLNVNSEENNENVHKIKKKEKPKKIIRKNEIILYIEISSSDMVEIKSPNEDDDYEGLNISSDSSNKKNKNNKTNQKNKKDVIKKPILGERVYILCDRLNGNDVCGFSGMSRKNAEMFVDGVKCQFSKYAIFSTYGRHEIKYILKDPLKSCKNMFYFCKYITYVDLSNFLAEKVTSMADMFGLCIKLRGVNFKGINTKSVEDLSGMFSNCYKLTDLEYFEDFNGNNVVDMSEMFSNCYQLVHINFDNFKPFQLANATDLFLQCRLLRIADLETFNCKKILSTKNMFSGCQSLLYLDVSNIGVRHLRDMSSMFSGCKNVEGIDMRKWEFASQAPEAKNAFENCEKLVVKIGNITYDEIQEDMKGIKVEVE